MRLYLFSLFASLLIASDAIGQFSASGQFIDISSNEAVESVFIQNKNQPGKSTLSDENGFFSIETTSADTLLFYRIGYESGSFVCQDTTLQNIEIIPQDFLLDEVIVTYEEAEAIYKKALSNLIANYSPETITYLWHGIQENEDEKQRVSYAQYLATTNHKKNGKMNFDLRLLKLNHLNNTLKKVSIDSPYHLSDIDPNEKPKQTKIIKVDSDDDSLILLRYIRYIKEVDASYTKDIIINRSDTVLLCNRISFSESDLKIKILGMPFLKTSNFNRDYNLSIKKTPKGYCIDKIESKMNFSFTKFGVTVTRKVEDTTTLFDINNTINSKKLEKLNGGTKQLFKLKATTTEHFWENKP